MKRRLRQLMLIAFPLAALALTGCVAAAVAGGAAAVGGGGAYMYSRGTYKAILHASLFDADRALRDVASRAKFIERKRVCDGYSADYLYQDLHDVKVSFKLKAITPESTRIYIHIGKLGDRASSQELLEEIDRTLSARRG